jgi:hypothetical protein
MQRPFFDSCDALHWTTRGFVFTFENEFIGWLTIKINTSAQSIEATVKAAAKAV